MQTLLSANYVAGYRVGMLFAGAGVLFVAQYFSSSMENYHYPAWRNAYFSAAALMLIGMATTLWVKEPQVHRDQLNGGDASAHLRFFLLFLISVATLISAYWFTPDAFLSGGKTWLASTLNNKVLASLLVESLRMAGAILMVMIVVRTIVSTELIDGKTFVASYVEPVREFVSRYRMSVVVLLLALVGLYRISDIVLGVISNVFYVDMGYSKSEIATVVKTLGLLMTILGGFLGGLLALRVGVISMLFLGAFLTIVTNLLFVLLSTAGHNLALLGAVISADNLTAGLASAAFIAFLSSLTNVKFTAVQYAIFSSMMTLIPKAFGGYSGTFVDIMGYQNFFIFTSLLGVPVLFLIWRLSNATGLEGIWQNPVSEQATRQD